MVARWEGHRGGGWVKKVKGLRRTNWQLQNSHRDVKYSIGNIVNSIVITMYGARQVLELSGRPLHKLYKCLTVCYIPETNIMIVNCICKI